MSLSRERSLCPCILALTKNLSLFTGRAESREGMWLMMAETWLDGACRMTKRAVLSGGMLPYCLPNSLPGKAVQSHGNT
jgi:hypothetical protein